MTAADITIEFYVMATRLDRDYLLESKINDNGTRVLQLFEKSRIKRNSYRWQAFKYTINTNILKIKYAKRASTCYLK